MLSRKQTLWDLGLEEMIQGWNNQKVELDLESTKLGWATRSKTQLNWESLFSRSLIQLTQLKLSQLVVEEDL